VQGVDPYTYLVDVLQRIDTHPAKDVALLTPRLWKEQFAENPLRSEIDRRQQRPIRICWTPLISRIRLGDPLSHRPQKTTNPPFRAFPQHCVKPRKLTVLGFFCPRALRSRVLETGSDRPSMKAAQSASVPISAE
jgi:hypothetical protein